MDTPGPDVAATDQVPVFVVALLGVFSLAMFGFALLRDLPWTETDSGTALGIVLAFAAPVAAAALTGWDPATRMVMGVSLLVDAVVLSVSGIWWVLLFGVAGALLLARIPREQAPRARTFFYWLPIVVALVAAAFYTVVDGSGLIWTLLLSGLVVFSGWRIASNAARA